MHDMHEQTVQCSSASVCMVATHRCNLYIAYMWCATHAYAERVSTMCTTHTCRRVSQLESLT